MIEIFEKEPFFDDSPYIGQCYRHPTYFRKDGEEYFMFSRPEPDHRPDKWWYEAAKKQLISTDGAYFKFHGFYDDPFEMLKAIAERKHHFVHPTDVYRSSIAKNGFVDFHGNLKEVSAAFHYRIYDANMIQKIEEAVEHINREEWDKV